MKDYLASFRIGQSARPGEIPTGDELTKLTNLPSEQSESGSVSFVSSCGEGSGITGTDEDQGEDVQAMLRVIAKEPSLSRQLEGEIEERSAILEYDANLRRDVAERVAERMTLENWLDVIDETGRKMS